MTEPALPRLFLSYGRADASELAEKLAADLRGHDLHGLARYETWRDRPEVKSGQPWTEQIAAALQAAAGVVAILTPHAVRTRSTAADAGDSVCLDEISYARFGARKPIVPAMAIPCEPPFEIYRLDYVDFTGWNSSDQQYRTALRQLLESIVAALAGEVRYRRWNDRLRPWDFDAFLDSKRRDFVGRAWLFEAIRAWLAAPGAQRTLLIVGDPGIGKSALVAELVHRNVDGCVIAYHCCQANVPETLRPGRFVRSVAAMIASRHPAYEALIDQSPYRELLVEEKCDRDPESVFEAVVLNGLGKAGPPGPGPRLIVIDALDEALLHADAAGRTIPGVLAGRLGRLPDWLKVVATSRPTGEVLGRLASLQPHTIAAHDPRNLDDFEAYVGARLAREPLAGTLAASGKDAAWVAATLQRLANGNFLYAQQALDGVAGGVLGFDALGALPPGLTDQFAWFFERQFGAGERWRVVKPLFEALVAAQEPLGERELSAAADLESESALPAALQTIAAYLRSTDEDPPRRELYHRSLVEWLTDPRRQDGAYRVSPTDGHRRLAGGLLADFQADRLNPTPYTLKHLSTHLAEAAGKAKGAERLERCRALAAFALDPLVHQQRVDDPFGMNGSLALALETAASAGGVESAPIVFEVALGWDMFRRERLDASRLFELARQGRVEAFERELELYPADEPWVAAARLVAAWLAREANFDAADRLRRRARTSLALDERVNAVFENRDPSFPPITQTPDDQQVADIFSHVGGTRVNPSMLWDQAAPPPPGERPDEEGVRYLAEFDAPVLVGWAQQPGGSTQRVRDYVALCVANAYHVYRNGSLWQVLAAVSRHRDADWVRRMAPPIVTAALAGGGREFTRAVELALLVCRVRIDPARRAVLDDQEQRLRSGVAAMSPARGRGDSWGEYRRSFGAIAEARRLILNEDPLGLLIPAVDIPEGFAGFQAPACLSLAESLFVCGAPAAEVQRALDAARAAAQNVQDLVFCARTTARVRALAEEWWPRPLDDAQLAAVIDRFVSDPRLAEFSTTHIVGDTYPQRRIVNPTSRLPAWLLGARTLASIAKVYQWPVADFLAVNDVRDPGATLADGRPIRVPDYRWAPMLASYLAARVLRAAAFGGVEKVRLLLKLAVRAAADPTALDGVLARLLLVLQPTDESALSHYEQVRAKYARPPASDAPAFEPMA